MAKILIIFTILLPGLDCKWKDLQNSNSVQNVYAFYPALRGNQIPGDVKDQYDPSRSSSERTMFDPSTPKNITAMKDANVYLYCTVLNVGNKTIVWIREHDLHILTVGMTTYTADDRFKVIHKENSSSWILKIHSVQERDAGSYQCQVNSQSQSEGPISFPVWLKVYVPSAKILGTLERFVNRGSTINLTCLIEHHQTEGTSATSFWLHNNKKINYESRENLVSVITDRGPIIKTTLLIHGATDAASGIYSCTPSPSSSVSVKIHILSGQPPAAMQTNSGIVVFIPRLSFILVIVSLYRSFNLAIFDIVR